MDRLIHLPTLHIDPARKLQLSYRGKVYQGVAGDTVATALYANGVRIFGRSLKYHRPRGLYSLDGECSNTCMNVDGIPNVYAETTPLKDGMIVSAQNVQGSPQFDWMAFMDKLDWAMPAGFYYRTMHRPARIWPIALKRVRKMAGLGRISPDFELQGKYDEIYPHADVCVIGGGPAGISAALAAAAQDLRVVLLESRPWPGGFFDYRLAEYSKGLPLYKRAQELAQKLEAQPNIRVFTRAAAVGAYINNLITAYQKGGGTDDFDERYIEVHAKSVVVATGCIERPLLFDHNERPGVMQINCAHRLAHTYGVLPGREAVFSVGHDLGLEAALDLHDLGLKISCVADARPDGQDPGLVAKLTERGIPFLPGWTAASAKVKKTVNTAVLSSTDGVVHREFPCDLLIASAGMTPVTGPLTVSQLTRLQYDGHTGFFLPAAMPPNTHAAGRLLGLDDPMAIEASGSLAGLEAAADCGREVSEAARKTYEQLHHLPGPTPGCKFVQAPVKGRKTFVCFDEDVTVKNVKQSIRMGFDVPELIKRFSSAGTGPGQGGIPGHNLPLLTAHHQAAPLGTAVPTAARAPMRPVLLKTYAGAKHDMCKRTPMHDEQVRDGGILRRIGVWERARYFSSDFTCREEVANVRGNVGMLDGSTLGKIRLFGPDALKVLQRIYISDMSRIKPGRVRYSAMCNDDGCLVDDGVVVQRGENDYYLTTSTARAGATIEWMRYHSRYEGWNFHAVNLTDAFGVINLAGPNARKVLEKVADADVSNETFPYGAYREFSVGGIAVRAMRLGFVGELSIELHTPSSYMQSLWEIVREAGREFGIRNFGVEAQNILRMEKGHIIIGSESEQRTTLLDVGLGFLWDRNKAEAKTVGSVALQQSENQSGRMKLVGFECEDPSRPPRDGSVVVDDEVRGYVCVARRSEALNKSVGMALVEAPLAGMGNRLAIFEDGCGGRRMYATVVPMPFYDPEGKRLRM